MSEIVLVAWWVMKCTEASPDNSQLRIVVICAAKINQSINLHHTDCIQSPVVVVVIVIVKTNSIHAPANMSIKRFRK
jgi:hypothetical protein